MSREKRHFIPVFLCLLLGAGAVTGQVSAHPKGIYVRFGLGYAPMVSIPRFNAFIDPLLSLQASNNSILYEVQWQSKRHFGVVFQYCFITLSASIRRSFTDQLQREFPNDYIIEYIEGLPSPYQNGKNPVQGLLGCSYAFDADKWSLQPRLLLGGTTFYPRDAEVALKQQSSNQLSILTLKPNNNTLENGSVSRFTFGFGALGQWNFWRRWSIFSIAEWTMFKPDLLYSYLLVNQVDGSETIRTYGSGSTQWVHTLHVGAGLTFRITRKPRSR